MTDDPSAPTRRPYRRRGMFWPLVLIGVGVVALLANYGIVPPVSVVALLALWPVLLVLLGIDIAFARRWPLPTIAAEIAIVVAALLLAVAQPTTLSLATFSFTGSNNCASPQTAVSVGRGSLRSLRLTVNGGAAAYRITGGSGGAVDASADGTQLCISDRSGSASPTAGDVRLSQSGANFGNATVTVHVANDVPLSLQLNAGAGDFLIDLHDVAVTDTRFSVGASKTTIVLPHPTGDIPIRLDGGASEITVEIPADVEARVVVTGGLISTSSTNPRATKNGGIIETAGYATAKDRVTVNITGGASSITVR
jgi:cell wall-active antibiotic response 4TMS protein YvqF